MEQQNHSIVTKSTTSCGSQNSNTSGEVRLPIGFRFRPTDEELVVHYLKRKALSLPLPASVIPELHVLLLDPWSLPGDLKEKKYYFCKRKADIMGNKRSKKMPTTSGFWKAVGKGKPIFSSGTKNDVVGTRKTWSFYQGKNQPYGHWYKTHWRMHEFLLVDSTQCVTYQAGDWAVCRIFQRNTKAKKYEIVSKFCGSNKDCILGIASPNYIDFKVENSFDLGPPQPSSPSTTD